MKKKIVSVMITAALLAANSLSVYASSLVEDLMEMPEIMEMQEDTSELDGAAPASSVEDLLGMDPVDEIPMLGQGDAPEELPDLEENLQAGVELDSSLPISVFEEDGVIIQNFVENPFGESDSIIHITEDDLILDEEYDANATKFNGVIIPNATTFTYNGKTQRPTLTIQNDKGDTVSTKNYTIKYPSSSVNVGTYKLTITFKNNYTGTASVSYKIVAKAGSKTEVVQAIGYKEGVDIYVKENGADGYQVKASRKKDMTGSKIFNASGSFFELLGLKKGETIYVQARSYLISGSKIVPSDWSTVKKVSVGTSKAKLRIYTSVESEYRNIYFRIVGGSKPWKVVIEGPDDFKEKINITDDLKLGSLNIGSQFGNLDKGTYKITVTDGEKGEISKEVELDY